MSVVFALFPICKHILPVKDGLQCFSFAIICFFKHRLIKMRLRVYYVQNMKTCPDWRVHPNIAAHSNTIRCL